MRLGNIREPQRGRGIHKQQYRQQYRQQYTQQYRQQYRGMPKEGREGFARIKVVILTFENTKEF